MRVHTKISALVGCVGLLGVTFAAIGCTQIASLTRQLKAVDNAAERVYLGERLNRLIATAVMESRGIYVSRNTYEAETFAKSLRKSLVELGDVLDRWGSISTPPQERKAFGKVRDAAKLFITFRTEIARLGVEVSPAVADKAGNNDAPRANRKALQDAVDHIVWMNIEEQSRIRGAAETRAANAWTWMVVLTAIGAALAIGAGWAVNRRLGHALAELANRDEELRRQNERFNTALENMSQGLVMFDKDQRLIVCNARYQQMYGLSSEMTMPGCTWRDLFDLLVSLGHIRSENAQRAFADRLSLVHDERPAATRRELADGRIIQIVHQPMLGGGWVATHEDITERQKAEAKIAHMAHHDALTGLPNRVLFREEMDRALTRVRRGKKLAIFCLDLDQFKSVNDTLGHPTGDTLLKAVADRLRGCVRDTDTVTRLGGDEFAIVQIGAGRPQHMTMLAERIIERLSAPYDLEGHQVVIGASVGIAISPDDGQDPDQLLKSADMALYRAKADGRGTFRFFEAEMDARMQARRALELELRKALSNGEFEVHYQPFINLDANEVSGFEALLRWSHPERGWISPADFIPLAEEIGLINQIGAWVLKQACADAATWPDDLRVAVNLSPVQFKNRTLVLDVISALGSSGLSAGRLELEITETMMLQETETTLATLHQLKDLGVHISLDDFGTGYSSLSYLRKFPIDKIKIDQSFIRDLPDGNDAVAIVNAVAGLGASLGMSTTAEGVETAGQLEKLRSEGCTEVQGWLFSPARPASEVADLLVSVAAQSRAAA